MAGILEEYINKRLGVLDLRNELKRLIGLYNKQTGRYLFVYAADFNKGRHGIDVSLMQDDFYTIQDMLRQSVNNTIDVYLETPGGSGETAEEIAKFLHKKFSEVNFVIAGEAKSAGTILALSGDNLYMCETGSLGPIDAQVKIGRSIVSAHDYKSWVDEKKKDASTTGRLNPFDAIMVAQISPGELYGVINSLEFAKVLVKEWLIKYKFKNWQVTETHHIPVTQQMKEERADSIAEDLCNHMNWKTHGRSLKRDDLKDLLKIENIDEVPLLADIIYRIKTVIRLLFDQSTDYKLYFTEEFNISRTAAISNPVIPNLPGKSQNGVNFERADIEIRCPKCGKTHKIPGYLNTSSQDIKRMKLAVNPNVKDNDILVCDSPGCNMSIDLKPIKNQIESETKKSICLK